MVTHYDPIHTYLVTRIERWEQLIEVRATSPEEARRLAKQDYGMVNDDPVFHSYTDESLWTVEEIEEP